LTDLH